MKKTYFTEKLKNPQAANDLLDKVEAAIMKRLQVAESFELYRFLFKSVDMLIIAFKKNVDFISW